MELVLVNLIMSVSIMKEVSIIAILVATGVIVCMCELKQ